MKRMPARTVEMVLHWYDTGTSVPEIHRLLPQYSEQDIQDHITFRKDK